MDDTLIKVAELGNEVEARILDEMLTDQSIPHVIPSYHDSALDGLFQTSWGWGCVEAPEENAQTVVEILNDLRSNTPDADEDASDEEPVE